MKIPYRTGEIEAKGNSLTVNQYSEIQFASFLMNA